MPRNSRIFLLLSLVLSAGGCGAGPNIPPTESIRSIHVSLNDPQNREYWNYEGFIAEENWPILLKHFSSTPYPAQPLKWQGLAVITIQTKAGEEFSIEVYDTQDAMGCYKRGDYYLIEDELQFTEDAKRLLTRNE